MYKNHYLNHVLGRPFNCSMALIGLVGGGSGGAGRDSKSGSLRKEF